VTAEDCALATEAAARREMIEVRILVEIVKLCERMCVETSVSVGGVRWCR
jgi:hypothetical protein